MKTDVLIELKALHLHGRTGAWAELVKQEGAVWASSPCAG